LQTAARSGAVLQKTIKARAKDLEYAAPSSSKGEKSTLAVKAGARFGGRSVMVPGGGFEPPTRGFSIRCSTN
jgi:hypothetical protein